MARGRVSAFVVCAAIVAGTDVWLAAQNAAKKPGTRAAPTAPSSGQPASSCGADVVKTLVGTWKAPQYRLKRTSEVGVQVFGPNASDVRDVELTIQPSGEGVLKISTSVVDSKGKIWAPTAIEAKISIGPGQTTAAGTCEPAVTTTSAEEQYLDESKYRAPMSGARVVLLIGSVANQLDLRFETPKGQGSFWTTMRRQAAR